MRAVLLSLMAVVLLFCGTASAQGPVGVELLPGYQQERLMGADTIEGRIWKPNALEIRYSIGAYAGDRASGAKNVLWSKERAAGGNRIARIVMTQERALIVTFAAAARGPRGGPEAQLPANFVATVKTEEDIADMLFMVMSYAGTPPVPR